MSAVAEARDAALLAAVGRHLDVQLESGRRLLDLVLRQGAAIRERDVEAVLARLADIKAEMAARELLEQERSALIGQAGSRPGRPRAALTTLAPPAQAGELEARSAELRGLLAEIAREHGINRALMRQELAFLDHLIRVTGEPAEAGGNRLMDVEA